MAGSRGRMRIRFLSNLGLESSFLSARKVKKRTSLEEPLGLRYFVLKGVQMTSSKSNMAPNSEHAQFKRECDSFDEYWVSEHSLSDRWSRERE